MLPLPGDLQRDLDQARKEIDQQRQLADQQRLRADKAEMAQQAMADQLAHMEAELAALRGAGGQAS